MQEPKLKPQLKLVAMFYTGECCGNAEKSAIKAGYSAKYARGNAYKLVARKDVREYIEYLKYLQSINTINPELHIATLREIQFFWTSIMENPGYNTKERLRASELLAKSKGAFEKEF